MGIVVNIHKCRLDGCFHPKLVASRLCEPCLIATIQVYIQNKHSISYARSTIEDLRHWKCNPLILEAEEFILLHERDLIKQENALRRKNKVLSDKEII